MSEFPFVSKYSCFLFFQEYLKPVLAGSDEQVIATARNVLYPFISFYEIASVLRRISLDERHFLSEYRETFDVIFQLAQQAVNIYCRLIQCPSFKLS